MKSRVALVACESYNKDEVYRAVNKAIDIIGGIKSFIQPGQKVLLKPNLCLAESPEKCMTTHPEIVRAISRMCIEQNANIVIGDNPVGQADRSRLNLIWERSEIALGLNDIKYKRSFLDNRMKVNYSQINGKEYEFYISEDVIKMDAIINIPKFKTHTLMTFTGAVKNLYGLLPGNSKKKLHSDLPIQKDFATLLVDIYNLIQPRLHVMDAVIGLEGDGPGARGERRKIGLIMASTDGIAMDSIAARLMNIDPKDILTNLIGSDKGYGEIDPEVVGESVNDYLMKDFKVPMTHKYNPNITKKIFDLSRAYVNIDSIKCRGCSLCGINCPASCINIENGLAVIDKNKCISCMTCQEICPEGAIYINRSNFYMQLSSLKSKYNKSSEQLNSSR